MSCSGAGMRRQVEVGVGVRCRRGCAERAAPSAADLASRLGTVAPDSASAPGCGPAAASPHRTQAPLQRRPAAACLSWSCSADLVQQHQEAAPEARMSAPHRPRSPLLLQRRPPTRTASISIAWHFRPDMGLPPYSGPFTVGVLDLEIPVRQPRSACRFAAHSADAASAHLRFSAQASAQTRCRTNGSTSQRAAGPRSAAMAATRRHRRRAKTVSGIP
jgi:hypothetical protein